MLKLKYHCFRFSRRGEINCTTCERMSPEWKVPIRPKRPRRFRAFTATDNNGWFVCLSVWEKKRILLPSPACCCCCCCHSCCSGWLPVIAAITPRIGLKPRAAVIFAAWSGRRSAVVISLEERPPSKQKRFRHTYIVRSRWCEPRFTVLDAVSETDTLWLQSHCNYLEPHVSYAETHALLCCCWYFFLFFSAPNFRGRSADGQQIFQVFGGNPSFFFLGGGLSPEKKWLSKNIKIWPKFRTPW